MEKAIDEAIKTLAGKSEKAERPDDAMKFAQAALNLAHVRATFDNMKR